MEIHDSGYKVIAYVLLEYSMTYGAWGLLTESSIIITQP